MHKTLAEHLAFVEAMHPQTVIELGLGRMRRMLEKLAIRFDCPVITVGGTNGKGSTCAMLEAVYRAAGYKTCVHTSPHLTRFNERARLNGKEMLDAPLAAALAAVEAVRGDEALTYFEYTALAILKAFQNEAPDVVILEIGLGGRLDAINALASDAAIVTTIGVDHEAFLGNTRESVAWEKAHIYRAGKPAVCAEANCPEKLLEVATAIGADLVVRDRDFSIQASRDLMVFKMGEIAWNLPLPSLEGVNQIDNAAGVLAIVAKLLDRLPVTPEAIAQGLTNTTVVGRFQKIADMPLTYIDVGHNPHAALVLAKNVASLPTTGKKCAVFGMLADKDMQSVAEIMRECFDAWYIAPLPPPRGANVQQLRRAMLEAGIDGAKIKEYSSVEEALVAAQKESQSADALVVFGSFVTVTSVLSSLALF